MVVRQFLCAGALLLLGGCGMLDWFGAGEEPPLPGTRVPVLGVGEGLTADPAVAGLPVAVPPPAPLTEWPQPGANPAHTPGHPSLNASFREAWSSSIGEGSSSNRRLTAAPIVADGRVFTLDANGQVTAIDTATGRQAWQVQVTDPAEDSPPYGGGVAFGNGLVYAATGFGEVLALDPANGGLVWRTEVAGPIRGAPTVDGGRLFVITVDNETEALDAGTGDSLWTHTGIVESAGLLGGASPAVAGGVLVAPYSSGELYALRVESGRPVWSDTLVSSRRTGPMASMADIRGLPVIDRGLVLALSHSGRMAAIDLRSGARVWEQDFAGINMPWVAGEFVFVVTGDAELVALTRDGGRIRWATALPRWGDPDDREDPIFYFGPVLAGGRLIVVGSNGWATLVAPDTGQILGNVELEDRTMIAPVIANDTLYVLSDDGTLTAYR